MNWKAVMTIMLDMDIGFFDVYCLNRTLWSHCYGIPAKRESWCLGIVPMLLVKLSSSRMFLMWCSDVRKWHCISSVNVIFSCSSHKDWSRFVHLLHGALLVDVWYWNRAFELNCHYMCLVCEQFPLIQNQLTIPTN